MPALALIHQQTLLCAVCRSEVAALGSHSVVTTRDGAVILFDDQDPPTQLTVAIVCNDGHTTKPPSSVKIVVAGTTGKAPRANNAVAIEGKTRSGKLLQFSKSSSI